MINRDVKSLLEAIGQALTQLSGEIEDLGVALCSHGDIVASHMQELQALDRISQKQRALAKLLDADCPISALGEMVLDDLAQQLHTCRAGKASELDEFRARPN